MLAAYDCAAHESKNQPDALASKRPLPLVHLILTPNATRDVRIGQACSKNVYGIFSSSALARHVAVPTQYSLQSELFLFLWGNP